MPIHSFSAEVSLPVQSVIRIDLRQIHQSMVDLTGDSTQPSYNYFWPLGGPFALRLDVAFFLEALLYYHVGGQGMIELTIKWNGAKIKIDSDLASGIGGSIGSFGGSKIDLNPIGLESRVSVTVSTNLKIKGKLTFHPSICFVCAPTPAPWSAPAPH